MLSNDKRESCTDAIVVKEVSFKKCNTVFMCRNISCLIKNRITNITLDRRFNTFKHRLAILDSTIVCPCDSRCGDLRFGNRVILRENVVRSNIQNTVWCYCIPFCFFRTEGQTNDEGREFVDSTVLDFI